MAVNTLNPYTDATSNGNIAQSNLPALVEPIMWNRSYSSARSALVKSSPAWYQRNSSALTQTCFAPRHGIFLV